ncbi:hypothetical protein H4S14_000802 [Agrobacterium vitis]|nr:hypothetical protein [Agrobacterium vitis]MBE1437075.1 hypothetical protein [Agrobacterium vitis]
MTVKYVAAPGRAIPGGWPADGRPVDPLSKLHRRMVADGDLVEYEAAPTEAVKSVSPKNKDVTNGQ